MYSNLQDSVSGHLGIGKDKTASRAVSWVLSPLNITLGVVLEPQPLGRSWRAQPAEALSCRK